MMPNNHEPTSNGSPNKSETFGERKHEHSESFAERRDEHGEPDAQQWRSVQEVAELEGLTERAIQKRCQRGFYVARLVEGDKGEVWEIDDSDIKVRANATANDAEPKDEPTANGSPNRSPNVTTQGTLFYRKLFW